MANSYLTAEGEKAYAMVEAYGLGKWYMPQQGNINVPIKEVTMGVMNAVNAFLRYHQDWCMGYENSDSYNILDDDDCILWVSERSCV